jgi:hypothetical protein
MSDELGMPFVLSHISDGMSCRTVRANRPISRQRSTEGTTRRQIIGAIFDHDCIAAVYKVACVRYRPPRSR